MDKFYNSLSGTGKNIIAALIRAAPTMEKSFPFVISTLQHTAKCSKPSVLRNIHKGEQSGLFERKNHDAGRRHGSIITLNKERCEQFLKLHFEEYAQLAGTQNGHDLNFIDSSHDLMDLNDIQTLNLENKTDLFFSSLSNKDKRVLANISELATDTSCNGISFIIKDIAKDSCCSAMTAQRAIKRGQENGLYTKKQHERGPRFGVILKLNAKPMKRIKKLLRTFPVKDVTKVDQYHSYITEQNRYQERNDTDLDTKLDRYGFTKTCSHTRQKLNPYHPGDNGNLILLSGAKNDRYQKQVLLDRQIENLSSSEEKFQARRLLEIGADEFKIFWPRLHTHRFGPNQIRQIVKYRVSGCETVLDLEDSLHAAEWELKHGTFPETHKGPCNYLFATLKDTGLWRRPVGFLTPDEQALADAEKEKSVIREQEKREQRQAKKEKQAKLNERFEAWLVTQTPEELAAIDSRCTVPPSTEESKHRWRRVYWGKNIYREEE